MKQKRKSCYLILQWMVIPLIALTSLPAYGAKANPEDYLPNASGGLRIGVAQSDKTIVLVDEPDLVKTVFDLGWGRVRNEWNERIVNFINTVGDQGAIEVVSDLATINNAELRVMKIENGASLKYILHENRMYLTWNLSESIRLSYVVNFDIEMALAIQASNQGQRLRMADAALNIRNTQLDGVDLMSKLTVPLIEALLQSVQEHSENVDNPLLPLMREIVKQLTSLMVERHEQIPGDAIYTDIGVASNNGMITFCFKSNAKDACTFPVRRR